MNPNIIISGRVIADGQPPFIVAELSGNHGQSLKVAEQMICAVAKSGAEAVKLQTYTADTITLNGDRPEFQIAEATSLWRGENLYSLYQKAHTPWAWHQELFQLAKAHGLIAFSSPFDESSVDFLEGLDVPCYKIASFELNHSPLLRRVAETGKPVIMSTGMATLDEIEEAVELLEKYGCKQLVLMKCTSCYPAPVSEANLATMADMKRRFSVPVGLSDHSKGLAVSILAAGLGANLIERHFVLDKCSGAVDSAFSLDAQDLSLLVRETREIAEAIGQVQYGPSPSERDSLRYRRSIYVCADLPAGALLTERTIRVVRPGLGMHPRYFASVLGRKLKVSKSANSPLLEDDLL